MKLNLVTRLIFYSAMLIFLSPYYDGWSPTARYLVREGVYESECTSAQLAIVRRKGEPKCESQAYKISMLLSFYRISEFLTSVFIGIFMDNSGPRLTVLISIFLRILSWVLIPIYYANGPVIMLCCILCGMTSNGLSFPVYTLSQYTDKFYNFCMIVISIAISVGTIYSVVLNCIYDLFPNASSYAIIYIKLAVTHLPFMVLSFFIFPDNLVEDVKKNRAEKKPPKSVEAPNSKGKELLNVSEVDAESSSSTYVSEKDEWKFSEFLKLVSRLDIVILSLSAMVSVVSLTFAQESFPIIYSGKSVAMTINEILVPLSFVFSLASVWFLNKFGAVPVILFLNVVSSIMHIALVFTSLPSSIIASVIMSLGYSLFVTQYYIYLDKEVPLTYCGSIKGCLVTSIGIALLSNIGLNLLARTLGSSRGIHIAFCIARLILTAPLSLLFKKGSNSYV